MPGDEKGWKSLFYMLPTLQRKEAGRCVTAIALPQQKQPLITWRFHMAHHAIHMRLPAHAPIIVAGFWFISNCSSVSLADWECSSIVLLTHYLHTHLDHKCWLWLVEPFSPVHRCCEMPQMYPLSPLERERREWWRPVQGSRQFTFRFWKLGRGIGVSHFKIKGTAHFQWVWLLC